MLCLSRIHALTALLTIGGVAGECSFCGGKPLDRPDLLTPFTADSIAEGGFQFPSFPSLPGPLRKLEGGGGHRQLTDSNEPDLLTCEAVANAIASLPDAVCPSEEDLADLLYICGCPDALPPPENACNGICQEGSPTNKEATPFGVLLDTVGSFLGDAVDVFRYASCEFVDLAFQRQSADQCAVVQMIESVRTSCGCGGDSGFAGCGICGVGVDLPDYSVVTDIPAAVQSTCAALDVGISFSESTEAACTALLATDEYMNIQDVCGCNGSPSGDGSCSVCPGGLVAQLPDTEIFTFLNLTGPGSSDTVTCGEAGPLIGLVSALSNATCSDFEIFGSLLCGCPPTEAGLRALCPQGEASTPDKVVPPAVQDFIASFVDVGSEGAFIVNQAGLGDGITCGELGNVLAAADVGSLFFESSIPFECGCPGITELTCPICSDGTSTPDEKIDLSGAGFTCGLLQVDVGLSNETSCSAAVAVEPYCDCPLTDVSSSACRLCDGVLLPDTTVFVELANATCGEIEFGVNLAIGENPADASICLGAQATFGAACCGGAALGPTTTPGIEVPTMTPGATAPTATPGSAAPSMGTSAPTAMAADPPSASPSSSPVAGDPTDSPTTSKAKAFAASYIVTFSMMILMVIYV